jgi:leucyl aminopeptidase
LPERCSVAARWFSASCPVVENAAEAVAEIALGARLRAYKFDRYKTKKKDDAEADGATRITFAVAEPAACRRADRRRAGLATA